MIVAMGLWFTMLWMPGHMLEGNDMLDDQSNADIMPVRSLSGQTLRAPALSPEARARLETNLASARAAYEANPNDQENIVWLGRRTAYLWGYHEAIQIFTEGLAKHPDSNPPPRPLSRRQPQKFPILWAKLPRYVLQISNSIRAPCLHPFSPSPAGD